MGCHFLLQGIFLTQELNPGLLHCSFALSYQGGHKQNLVCTRTQEKGAVTPQETDSDLPGSVQESPAEAWVGGGLLQGWGH